MSKNTDLSELINYVKGASTGQLVAPFYTSPTSFTGTIAGYLGFDSSGNILTASGGSQWVTSGSNIYYNAGRVGIGTASPNYRLSVLSAPSAGGFDGVSVTSGTNDVISLFRTGSSYSYGMVGANQSWMYSNFGDLNIMTDAGSASIKFGTQNGSERLRITPNGNLTLGTTNPHQGDIVAERSLTIFGGSLSSIGLTNGSSGQKGTFSYNSQQIDITNNSTTGGIGVTSRTQGVFLFVNGSSWTSMSDESTKTDLNPIVDGLNKVVSLRALTGRYKTDEEGKSRAFLIAQDVQSVLPEAVTKNLQNDKLMLSYTDVIPLLVASIKELKIELDNLKANN
jgi:hypothetical protein